MIAALPAQHAAIRAQRGAAVGVRQAFEGPQRDRGQSLRWRCRCHRGTTGEPPEKHGHFKGG